MIGENMSTPLAVLIVANGQPPSRFECDAILDSIPEFQGQFTIRPIGGGAPLPDPNDSRGTSKTAGVLVYLNFPEFMDENITYQWRDGKLVIAIFKK